MLNEKEIKSGDKEPSIDDSLAEIIDMKKNENSALKKIVNSLIKESFQDSTNKK